MNKKIKRMISVLVCVMLMIAAIPAAAQENIGLARYADTIICDAFNCGKTAYFMGIRGISGYQRIDDYKHSVYEEYNYRCPDSHLTIRGERIPESHSWFSYESIAHGGHYHKYTVRCRCGHSQVVEIICTNWETEGHKTPW